MLDFLVIVVVEILFYYLIQYPGAGIRWLLAGGKRSFKTILKEDQTYKNGFAGYSFFVVVLLICVVVIK